MPKVSICIPTYRQPECLKRLLDSVFEQTYTDYEVIITDDTPDDSIKKVVDLFLDSRIRYYKNKTTLGSPENWNEAIRLSNSEYIKIMHHDDCFSNNMSLQKIINLITGNVDFAFCASYVILKTSNRWIHSMEINNYNKLIENPAFLLKSNYIGGPSAVIFKNDLNIIFDKNLKWLVDVDFYIEVIKQKKCIQYTQEPLVFTYESEGRVTDECQGIVDVELTELLYCIEKHSIKDLSIFFYLIRKIKEFNLKSYKQILKYGKLSNIFTLFYILYKCKLLSLPKFLRQFKLIV